MYGILRTQTNGGNGEDPQAECAVIHVGQESLDDWLGMMDQAEGISDKLGKDMTLVFDDWTPTMYAEMPDEGALSEDDAMALEDGGPGYCLTDTEPFPPYEAAHREESWVDPPAPGEPVRLSYCEMRVSATALSWWYGPKYGDNEEYTYELGRTTLERWVQTVKGTIHA